MASAVEVDVLQCCYLYWWYWYVQLGYGVNVRSLFRSQPRPSFSAQFVCLTWLFQGSPLHLSNAVRTVWAVVTASCRCISVSGVINENVCLCLWFSGHRRILVTGRTSAIYSRCLLQQPASNSSSGGEGRNAVCQEARAERALILAEEAEMEPLLFHGLGKRKRRGE